jgi:uncharacterized protein YjiS (DUF1127 family)
MSCTYKTCSTQINVPPAVSVRPKRPTIAKAFVTIAEVLQAALAFASIYMRVAQRRRARRELRMLDSRLLKDIGLTREAAESEVRKSFWQ